MSSPVLPTFTIVLLTALLCKFVRLRNHYLFTHAKWLLLLMTWCCNGKSLGVTYPTWSERKIRR